MYSISFIGASNVAFRFSLAMQEKGFGIGHIYNRSAAHRDSLIRALNSHGGQVRPAETVGELFTSDFIFLCVSDDAISQVVGEIASALDRTDRRPVFLHTSGATGIDVFAPLDRRGCSYGVFYPVMTLKKNKEIDFRNIPLLLEGSDESVRKTLGEMAERLGAEYLFKTSEERLSMHVAAVFSCNFVNYLLDLAFSITERDRSLLLPSTLESVRNCFLLDPAAVLTGPAKRGDRKTLQKHLDLLEKKGMKEQAEIYRLLSRKIIEKQTEKR